MTFTNNIHNSLNTLIQMDNNIIRCDRCMEILKPDKVVWLELSITDGKYYKILPKGHESQRSIFFW